MSLIALILLILYQYSVVMRIITEHVGSQESGALWLGAAIPTVIFQPNGSHLQGVPFHIFNTVYRLSGVTYAELPNFMLPELGCHRRH